MAEFLSTAWFEDLNGTLDNAGPIPFEGTKSPFRIVLELSDAPASGPHALTFTMTGDGAEVAVGDHLAADALISLTYADALALWSGQSDSATALREGRVKVRGDINAIVPLLSWLQRAHPQAEL